MIGKIERFLPHPLVPLAFILTFIYLYFSAVPLFQDTDAPWHLAAGALILDQGKIPASDPWSFTANGYAWYLISWLWDVIMEAVNRVAGLKGLFIFIVATVSLIPALLARSLLARGGIGSDAKILALFLCGLCLIEFTEARPQLVGYLCVILFHYILHQSRERQGWKQLIPLPLLMILWVNTHGSFMVGLSLIGAYGVESMIHRRWEWFRHLFIFGVLCTLALAINPYGIYMYDAVMRSLDSVVTKFILEWMPFVFTRSLSLSVYFLVFVLIGVMREARVPIADSIISLLWFIAMLFSVRNAAIFVLVSLPAMAIALQSLVEQLESIRTHRPDVLAPLEKPGKRFQFAVATVFVVVAATLAIPVLKGDGYVTPKIDPMPAIAYLRDHAAGKRVLNEYNYGGRIVYETRGTVPVFADGRSGTAFPEEVLAEYLEFMHQNKGWDHIISKYRIDVIMVDNRHLFAMAYDQGMHRDKWKRVYHDDVAGVYERKK